LSELRRNAKKSNGQWPTLGARQRRARCAALNSDLHLNSPSTA
jgi:hypothetical protein